MSGTAESDPASCLVPSCRPRSSSSRFYMVFLPPDVRRYPRLRCAPTWAETNEQVGRYCGGLDDEGHPSRGGSIMWRIKAPEGVHVQSP